MIAYLRYSPRPRKPDTEKDKVDSLAKQRWQIEQWISQRGLPAIEEWIEDPFISATTALEDRPGGARLMDLVADGETEVIVTAPDRLFRDVSDGIRVLRQWGGWGVTLYTCIGVSLDSSSASARLITTIFLAISEWEADNTRERTSIAMKSKGARGMKNSSREKYGWRLVADEEDGKRVVRHDTEQQAIQTILAWYDDGTTSTRELARMADLHRLPRRGSQWRHVTVRRILVDNGRISANKRRRPRSTH